MKLNTKWYSVFCAVGTMRVRAKSGSNGGGGTSGGDFDWGDNSGEVPW